MKRCAAIVLTFVVVGPLVASLGLFVGHVLMVNSSPRYALSFAQWPAAWLNWVTMAYMIGAPYALLIGGVFALLAVFAGTRQLLVAIAVASAPLPFVHLLPAVGEPIWKWPPLFWQSAIALAGVSTITCWYLSRRWLGQHP
jgi:hypothetical protein